MATAESGSGSNGSGYRESPFELRILQLWDQHPFGTVERVVRAIVAGNAKKETALRNRLLPQRDTTDDAKNGTFDISNAFTLFYQGRSCDTTEMEPEETIISEDSKARSFRLDVSYLGSKFCGWQRQPGGHPLPSVQQTLEDALEKICGHPVSIRVSGRTDAGVHAVAQVARVRTTNPAVQAADLIDALQAAADGSWQCWQVVPVSSKFHPTWGTLSRSYVYVVDAGVIVDQLSISLPVLVHRLDCMLRLLQDQALDFVGISYGKVKTETTICTLYHARAVSLQESPATCNGSTAATAVAIELTGDRFLRRMVRILVATAMVLAVTEEWHQDMLLEVVEARDRRRSAKAAPPSGLVFVGAHVVNDASSILAL